MKYYRPMRTTRNIKDIQSAQKLPWYRITNQASGPAMVSIFNEIGGPWGVTAGDFVSELSAVNGDVELHLNCPGGDVFDAVTIFNSLKQRKGTVTVVVDGLAASAASFIAQAASPGQLYMAPHSKMMIHLPFGAAMGNADDMRKTADLMDSIAVDIANIYSERSGKPADHWQNLMSQETWFSDREAVTAGLADSIHGEDITDNWDLSVYNVQGDVQLGDGWVRGADGTVRFDPDGDGDDDSTPDGDTDGDYWDENGDQIQPIPPRPDMANKTVPAVTNEKYNTDDRKRMASEGSAMPDGSYPIADEEDLHNAIHAVGRGNADHDAIRRHIIKRAKALGASDQIPDNWNADGSINETSNEFDTGSLAALFLETLRG